MLASACAFGWIAALLLRKSYRRAAKGVATRGTIIGSEFYRAGNSVYLPKVEFETLNGEKIIFVSSSGSNAEPKIGREVKVLYSPDNPRDADIVSLLRSWILPLFILAIAIFFLFFSIEFYTSFFGAAA